MRPPFSLVLPKKMGRARSKRKTLFRPKLAPLRAQVWACTRGPRKRLPCRLSVEALGAVLVLAISISLASGLRRKLTHFDARPLPTKTAALGFRGGPYFAETSGFPPATDCHRGPGCRTDLTPSSPPLPLCPARGKLRARGAHPAAGGPTPRRSGASRPTGRVPRSPGCGSRN